MSFFDMVQEFGWSTALWFTGVGLALMVTVYLVVDRWRSKRWRDEDRAKREGS